MQMNRFGSGETVHMGRPQYFWILSSKLKYSLPTGILSEIRTKLRDWAIWQARASCYFQAALSSNDSKTL